MRTIVFILMLVAAAYGQTETLTNADVIELTRAGLPADIIIKKLNTAETHLDVTAAGLIELKKANVEDEVIAVMIELHEDKARKKPSEPITGFSESGPKPGALAPTPAVYRSKKEILNAARTIALVKSSVQPSRQALEKELMKRNDFQSLNLTIERYKDKADLYVEIGYVSFSWITHRYVYRIFDRRSGAILAAGETTSWGSLAENLANHISKSLLSIRDGKA